MKAIEFENIGKQYRLGLVSSGTISHDLNRWWTMNVLRKEDPYLRIGEANDRAHRGKSDYVWALKDINFSVEEGEVVGIIGKNGAGKSTLLKLLSRVTSPTTGRIKVRGRIASLLEVGTGFHPEMTGRENIYMNGAIMGMTKAEITRKLDEIIEFSGCERYIDTPVKRYSSGMTVRLGFAIAAHLEPEILVVDEVLAVGDAEFQKKAIGKMQDVSKGEGRTVLFVSHNMNAIRNLCKRGIVLGNGTQIYDGKINDAVNFYLKNNSESLEEKGNILNCITQKVSYLHIHKILFNGTSNNHTIIAHNQPYLDIVIEGETDEPMKCDITFILRNIDQVPLATLNEGHFMGHIEDIAAGPFYISKRIILPKYLCRGDCYVDLALHQPDVTLYFYAPQCIKVTFEGSMGEYGHTLNMDQSGLLGL